MLEKANRFLAQNGGHVNPRYRPRYHAAPPVGWCNDPNGFYFDGTWYHVFYQFYPYEPRWNSMHWGHWRSRDLLSWESLPVAMAPDSPFDRDGCFSGTAWPTMGGAAHILYTGVHDGMQEQCLAHYKDGHMEKAACNPVIPASSLPEGYSAADFRDPKLFPDGGRWRAVMAAWHRNGPHLVSFVSDDLERWQYDGRLCDTPCAMPECPDVFDLDGQRVIMYSRVAHAGETGNPHSVQYSLGSDWREVDAGWNFYAAQTCAGAMGERVMIAWMASWTEAWPTCALGHGWAGMMTLPRVLRVEDGRLCQSPPLTLEARRGAHWQGNGSAKHAELRLAPRDGAGFVLRLMETGEEYVRLVYANGQLTLDRSRLPLCREMQGDMSMKVYAPGDVRVFIDACSIEVFAGGGVLSALAFPQGEGYGITLESGEAVLEGWELE